MVELKGLILKSTGSFYRVTGADGKEYRCRIKGKMRTRGIDTTNPIAVGDRVLFEVTGDEGMITRVLDRKNYIIRKSVNLSKQAHILAANIDLALVVATPVLPRTSTGFIDRFLATAEAYNIPGGVVFNKSDLYDEEIHSYVQSLSDLYQSIGYLTFVVSAIKPDTLTELKHQLQGKITLLSGHSGTGKSTLINALVPGLELKTAGLSTQHLKGKHTTTFAEMHPLTGSGYIIDTPGIREFGILEFNPKEVSHFFPEIFKVSKNCKFNNCVHRDEKECAVIKAVEASEIAASRYNSYLSILQNEDIFN